MTAESSRDLPTAEQPRRNAALPAWAGVIIVVLAAGIVVLLGLLAISIMERRVGSAAAGAGGQAYRSMGAE